ncbi:hypothetical protein FSARC_10031 [Fusarium sarcochroum]|uniref:Ankyrin repeat protein n=1 Tax=Fusarium sarcochroum TaxID=1208366 RepID=A0A8H4TPR7_9HYPO|nr:hypothetical protein FSARC_10031 [Fusarium sarcochroum]
MADNRRVEWFLGRAGLHAPPRLSRLTEPAAQDFLPFDKTNRDAARQLLIQQRTADPNYKPPAQQKRHIFRSKDQKAEACNTSHWTFTKHEVAKAFDALLSQQTLPPTGVAQALLLHTTLTSMDELWGHFHDPQLEKQMKRHRMSSNPTGFNSEDMSWLDKATSHDNFNHIHLLCQTQVSQGILDRSLGIALSKSSLQAMKLLLSFGATASSYQEPIDQHIRARNLELVSLLLSAPSAMESEAWKACLEQEFVRSEAGQPLSLSLILLLLSNRPDLVSDTLLLKTLGLQNFQATAAVLGYASSNSVFFGIRHQACEVVSHIADDGQRLALFTLLSESGLVADNLVLREELVTDVLARQLPLVKLLVQAGVSVDVPPHNALQLVVSHLDFDMLELLRYGTFSSPPAQALNYLPETTSELDMIHFMNLFGYMGLSGELLDSHLVRAAQRKQRRLVETLLRYGASVEFGQAAAIYAALASADLEMLSILLQGDCAPAILSTTIPVAIKIPSRSSRMLVIRTLLEKGVESQALGSPLQGLVSEDGDIDAELVKLLLEHQAPLDQSEVLEYRPVLVATKRGDAAVLNMLCNANPLNETLAAALPIAFNGIETFGYDVALDMITLLLKQGASGPTVHKTLLGAMETDIRLDIVRVLVHHGADVNYSSGAAFVRAVETDNNTLLELLCSSFPPSQATVNAVLPKIIDPKHYSLATLELFLGAASRASPKPTLSNTCSLLKDHPQMTEIVPCLLNHGMDVNEESGMVLRLAIREINIGLFSEILAHDPNISSLSNAFTDTLEIEPKHTKLELMRCLLEKASPARIGQSEALLDETQSALQGDMDGLWLLLGHKADVNFDGGAAVQAAASSEAGYPILLNMLLSSGATSATVEAAFDAASSSDTPSNVKIGIFGSLFAFNKSISVEVVSRALIRAFEKHPEDEHLLELLLEHGARIGPQTLKTALDTSPSGLFHKLIGRVADMGTRNDIFKHLREKTTLNTEDRLRAYEVLLKQGVGLSELSGALLEVVEDGTSSLEIAKLLLDYSATVNHKENKAFITALQSRNLDLVELLSQYLVKGDHDEAASLVFEHPYLRENPSIDPSTRTDIYKNVLKCNIDKKHIYNALCNALEAKQTSLALVRLLLEHGANPNDEEGHCFYLAGRHQQDEYFRELSKHADLVVVLPTLLRRFDKETQIAHLFQVCMNDKRTAVKELSDQLLFRCIRKFQKGTMLLSLLLDFGMSPGATTVYRIHKNWPEEEITLLIWTIISPLKIDTKVVLRLLREGRDARPEYTTLISKVSAIYLSLLDKSRTPVLNELLELDSASVFNSTISGSTFSSMATFSKKPKTEFSTLFEDDDEISPREASLFLGNLPAFKLLNKSNVPDDGTLHLASLLALPDFVKWLLEKHEPNYEEENFGFMVPLALTCFSKPFPWCKVANEEKMWIVRLEETMQILIPRTMTGWRYRQKLPLHLALENGSAVTMAMLRALDVRNDAKKEKAYLYTDKTGKDYSLNQYLNTFVEISGKERGKLRKCLEDYGFQ